MPLKPLGKVTVPAAGTPVQLLTAMQAAGLQFKSYHAIHLQVLKTNGGDVYIGTATMVRSTLVGCIHVLPAPTSSFYASFGIALIGSAAGVDVSELYLDVDTNGEGVLVTLLEA